MRGLTASQLAQSSTEAKSNGKLCPFLLFLSRLYLRKRTKKTKTRRFLRKRRVFYCSPGNKVSGTKAKEESGGLNSRNIYRKKSFQDVKIELTTLQKLVISGKNRR